MTNIVHEPVHASASARESSERELANPGRVMWLGVILVGAALPLFVVRQGIATTAALNALASRSDAWLPAASLPYVTLLSPLAVLSALVLVMAPGLVLALALNRARTVPEWILHGFALSLLTVSMGAGVTQAVLGRSLEGNLFVAIALALTVLFLLVLTARLRAGSRIRWPLAAPHSAQTVVGMAVVPMVLLIALAPKFYWESFNGDGAHAYEAARLLLYRAVPFFDADAGDIAGFPGSTSFLFAYPTSWFIRLFGPLEVSARLPLLLYLVAAAAAVMAVAEEGRKDSLGVPERWLIWLALLCYVVAVGFSATYSPYSADLALPATQDTLLVVSFLGFVVSFLRRAWVWATLWAFLTYTALPNGLVLLGMWLGAWWLVQRPRRWREVLLGGSCVVAALVIMGLAGGLLNALGWPGPGAEYGAAGVLLRFAFLQLTDWPRLAYVVVPCGILPALSMVWWRRQDGVARAVTVTTLAYFLFCFVQAHAPLHYYIPAMILPLVVYWRLDPASGPARPKVVLATGLATLAALALSWPSNPRPFMAARMVGRSVAYNVGGYERFNADALRASTLLHRAVPYDWDPAVPHSSLGGSPLVFQYYANTASPDTPRNYVLQRVSDPPPDQGRLIARENGFALYVRDDVVWRDHLALRPPTPAGARIYQQSRSILFRSVPHSGGPVIIDLPAVAQRLGIDVEALARRLGVGS